MIKAFGVILTLALLTGSVVGTVASGWILGEALHPARSRAIFGPFTLGLLLAGIAVVIEGIRLAVSVCGEQIWRRSHFQGVAFAVPLWLGCTAYCTMMPLLALALVPLLPAESQILTVIAPAWAAVQIAAGLLPGISWFGEPKAAVQPLQGALPARPAIAARPVKAAQAVLAEAVSPTAEQAAPAQLVTESAASADEFFRFLSRLSELPAGSTLPRRGRIGMNHEIFISQAGLAGLVGRSKPTVRRWLQELERGARIVKRPNGKDTCILLQEHAHRFNGATHLNGAANGGRVSLACSTPPAEIPA